MNNLLNIGIPTYIIEECTKLVQDFEIYPEITLDVENKYTLQDLANITYVLATWNCAVTYIIRPYRNNAVKVRIMKIK